MAAVGIEVVGLERTERYMADVGKKIDGVSQRVVSRGALRIARAHKVNASGRVLKVRSGEYRAAINATPATRTANGWEARAGVRQGPASPYARVHETGATIRPKRGMWLTFPILSPGGGMTVVGWRRAKEVVLRARRPLGQAYDAESPKIGDDFKAEMDKALRA